MNSDIHRLLDEAFAGVNMTPDAQDLKEEIRANLVARVDELEAAGVSPTDAARRAIDELGDISELLDSTPIAPGAMVAPASSRGYDPAYLQGLRVRPQPGFVVRTVLLSLLATASLAVLVLGAFGIVPIALGALLGVGVVLAVSLGFVAADALRQETTSNHPMPTGRATAFGVATGGALLAVSLGVTFAVHLEAVWLVVVAAILLVASIGLFSWLGATQTNRHKAWTREYARNMAPNRFEADPAAAARFGIYSEVIWILTLGFMVLFYFTLPWFWAVIALVAGLAIWMIVLARMLFDHTS